MVDLLMAELATRPRLRLNDELSGFGLTDLDSTTSDLIRPTRRVTSGRLDLLRAAGQALHHRSTVRTCANADALVQAADPL